MTFLFNPATSISGFTAYPSGQSNQVLQDTRALERQASLFSQPAYSPSPSTLAAVASTFSPTQTSLYSGLSPVQATNTSIFSASAPTSFLSTSSSGGGSSFGGNNPGGQGSQNRG
jgi:hypothetical protein